MRVGDAEGLKALGDVGQVGGQGVWRRRVECAVVAFRLVVELLELDIASRFEISGAVVSWPVAEWTILLEGWEGKQATTHLKARWSSISRSAIEKRVWRTWM